MGKVWTPISQVLPIRWVLCCIFLYYGKFNRKPMKYIYHMMETVWREITHTMGKVWVPISQVHPIRRVLLHFPILWKIDGETHAFPIWWSIPFDGNCMEKNRPYYGKSVSTNFPVHPYVGFCYIFPYYEKLTGKPIHFPYDEVYHRIVI